MCSFVQKILPARLETAVHRCSGTTFLPGANNVDRDTGENIYQLTVEVNDLMSLKYHSVNAAALAPIVYKYDIH